MLQIWLTLFIIITTIVGVAVGRYPKLHLNPLVGATLLIATNAMSLEQAYANLDLDTLILLFAMMILKVNLRLAGFFRLVASKTVYWAQSPRQLLALKRNPITQGGVVSLTVIATILSNLISNVPAVLLFRPLMPTFPNLAHPRHGYHFSRQLNPLRVCR